MVLRVTDAVVADHDITNTVTGHAVTRGARPWTSSASASARCRWNATS